MDMLWQLLKKHTFPGMERTAIAFFNGIDYKKEKEESY